METTEIVGLVAGIVALGIAVLAYWRSGRPVTLEGVTQALETTGPLAEQIRDVAEVVVEGVQQLKESGKIETSTDAFDTAMGHLEKWFPDVEPERLVPFIEAAYRAVKLAGKLAEAQRWGASE